MNMEELEQALRKRQAGMRRERRVATWLVTGLVLLIAVPILIVTLV